MIYCFLTWVFGNVEFFFVISQEFMNSGQVNQRMRTAKERLLLLANHLHHRLERTKGRTSGLATVWSLRTREKHTSVKQWLGRTLSRLLRATLLPLNAQDAQQAPGWELSLSVLGIPCKSLQVWDRAGIRGKCHKHTHTHQQILVVCPVINY